MLTNDNILVIYRSGDSDSQDVAETYATYRGIDSDLVQGIACSGDEILLDEATFNTEVLNPIRNIKLAAEALGYHIYAIVLSYGVPGGFLSGLDAISSTSRLSRIDYAFSKKTPNNLFDRKVFKAFDATDAVFALVVSRLDAPTVEIAKSMITNSDVIKKQYVVNGTFYIDPYSNKTGVNADKYKNAMLDFQVRVLSSTNLDSWSTTFLDPYIDEVIPSVIDDSFIWSWFTDRSSSSFFKTTNAIRIFAYNADNDGAATVRSLTGRRWPALAMQSGYAATAGSMSNPGYDGFLFPTPFFTTLLNGSTIGEAFLFSQPYLNWTISVFGDPLIKVGFPATDSAFASTVGTTSTAIAETESWRLMEQDLARAIAYYAKITNELETARDTILHSSDVNTEVELLYPFQSLYLMHGDTQRQAEFDAVTNAFLTHIEQRYYYKDLTIPVPTAEFVLELLDQKVSELIYDVQQDDNRLVANNLLDVGSWQVEVPILDETGSYALYHFRIQVSDSSSFSNILIDVNSSLNILSWYYEEHTNEFIEMPDIGVASNYVGKRVQYRSRLPEYLNRASKYYFRILQLDNTTCYPWRTFGDIIFT